MVQGALLQTVVSKGVCWCVWLLSLILRFTFCDTWFFKFIKCSVSIFQNNKYLFIYVTKNSKNYNLKCILKKENAIVKKILQLEKQLALHSDKYSQVDMLTQGASRVPHAV